MKKIILSIVMLLTIVFGGEEKVITPPFAFILESNAKVHRYFDVNEQSYNYTDANKQEHHIELNGQHWAYRIFVDKKEHPQKVSEILKMLEEKGAKVLYYSKEKKRAYIQYEDTHQKVFIEIAYGWSDNYRIYITKERYLIPGEATDIVFDENQSLPKKVMLRVPFDGKHYYTLKVDVLEGQGVKVDVMPEMENAAVRIRHKSSMTCDSQYYKHYTLYDIDPYKAIHDIYVDSLDDRSKVTLTLVKTPYTVTALGQISNKPALVKMKNSLSSLPVFTSIGRIFGDYEMKGDYMPNGDAVYWLNNGYYSLVKDHLRSNLVPALANHKTVIDWPMYYEEMKRGTSTEHNASTKMAIYEAKSDDNKSVEVDLSLSHLPKEMNLTKDDFTVLEDGMIEGKIVSMERLHEAMNIVILLDSSGSMKKSMKLALRSVKSFIEKLPEDAHITLVDFDTKVKMIKAKNRTEMLKKLSKIKANGATALYDSVIKSTKLLKEKSRASVILFTDGKDANYNDTKRGSKATFEMMIKEVQKNKIPIYPIAFGNGADTTSLMTIAQITKTTYYQGDTEEKLRKIFDDIRHTLSSAYKIRYERGKAAAQGSQTLVNYMVDVSGSMDLRHTMYKDCEGCGYRFEQLKTMLAQSVAALPEHTFIQLNTFESKVETLQIMTQDKAKILAGIGAIKIGGGTKIVKAIKKGLALSKILPSNRRYFIFTTDAAADAFKFNKEEKKELNAALLAFKRSGIQTFWLGMWEDKKVLKNMNYLAKLSGGEAFVSSDIGKIKEKILKVTQKINENNMTQESIGSVVVKVKKVSQKDGQILTAVGEKALSLPLLKKDKADAVVKDIAYKVTPYNTDQKSYNFQNASVIYGDDTPLKDVRMKKVLHLMDDHNKSIEGKNSAVVMKLSKAYLFDRIKGINAGNRKQYLVLDLNISNILPSQQVAVLDDGSKHPSSWIGKSNTSYKYRDAIPTYKIPSLKNHLFIRVNNSYEVPFYPLTWALEKPLTEVDEMTLSIEGNSSKSGVLLFNIPDEPIVSLSLHYYDTAYGHIDLPVIGSMEHSKVETNLLLKENPEKLSDAFSLSVLSTHDENMLVGINAGKKNVFKVVDINIESQVNALLKLDPKKRFYLKIETDQGDWMLSPHAITARIPLGFFNEVSLAPGSHNRLALAFLVPEKLRDYPQSLIVELKGEDKIFALLPNNHKKEEKKKSVLAKVKGDKIDLRINTLYTVPRLDGTSRKLLLADITLSDKADGTATHLHNMLMLSNQEKLNFKGRQSVMGSNAAVHKGLGAATSAAKELESSQKAVKISAYTQSRILGCDNLVMDGYTKRCLVLFELGTLDVAKPLYLVSPIFTDLKEKIVLNKVKELSQKKTYLLNKKLTLAQDDILEDIEKILKKVRHEKVLKGKMAAGHSKRKVTFDSQKDLPQEILPLSVSYAGAQKMAEVHTLKEAIKMLKSITWVPAGDNDIMYSSESMFTQEWGSEYEMSAYIYSILKSNNMKIKSGSYELTEKGKAQLASMSQGIPITLTNVPFLSWEYEGKKESIVFPFLKSADALSEEIDIADPSRRTALSSNKAEIKMKLYYEKKKSSGSMQIGGMGAALSGGVKEEEKYSNVFSERFPLSKISNMPIDIWFGKGKDRDGKEMLKSFIYDEEGIDEDLSSISAEVIPKRLEISLYDGQKHLDKYTFRFKKEQQLQDLFFTFSFSTPDLCEEALLKMEKVKKDKFVNIKNLEPLSLLQWMNRNMIYRFVGLQSHFEAAMQEKLHIQVKRNKNPRTIMVMQENVKGEKLVSSIDLRSVHADVYGDLNNIKAFNIASGMFATESEGNVVPKSETVFTLWEKSKALKLLTILPNKKEEALAYMKDADVPEWIRERLDNSHSIWLFPASSIEGRYGWLEIDEKSYQMLSVLDNGQYSAMTETVITQENIETTTRYFLGLLIGNNIAIGSVINYSMLGYESINEIKKRANKLAKVLGCYVKKFESVSADPLGTAKGAAKDEAKNQMKGGTGDAIENMINSTFDCKNGGKADGKKPKAYKDYVNFAKGIDHAISLYFKNMK